jgi:hypothetical protein
MSTAIDPTTVVSPGRIVDVLSTDQGAVVLVLARGEHRVVRLSVSGSEVLDAVGTGTSISALEVELRRRLGDPPDGDLGRAVRRSVLSLVEMSIVRIGPEGPIDT